MSQFEQKIIDLNKEHALLVELINNLWDGCDTPDAQKAIRVAFQQGLVDAKMWIDGFSTMRIAAVLNQNDKVAFPLDCRKKITYKGDSHAYYFDALYSFDSNLTTGLRDVWESVSNYKRWNFSKKASALCLRISKDFPNLSVAPKQDSKAIQDKIARSYKGEFAESAASFSTPEKLLFKHVDYGMNHQGFSYHRTLFSTVYSHGLFCAQLKNTQTLVSDLLPIYSKREEALNFDNGDEILEQAIRNPFVSLINQIEPFEFFSKAEYEENRAKKIKSQANSEKDITKITEELLNEIAESDDLDCRDVLVNEIVDKASVTFKHFELS